MRPLKGSDWCRSLGPVPVGPLVGRCCVRSPRSVSTAWSTVTRVTWTELLLGEPSGNRVDVKDGARWDCADSKWLYLISINYDAPCAIQSRGQASTPNSQDPAR